MIRNFSFQDAVWIATRSLLCGVNLVQLRKMWQSSQCCPCREKSAMGMNLGGNGFRKLEYSNFALIASNFYDKEIYASRIHVFYEGDGSQSGLEVEALLFCWILLFVLSSGLKDGLNSFPCPLAILFAKGRGLPLSQYISRHYMPDSMNETTV